MSYKVFKKIIINQRQENCRTLVSISCNQGFLLRVAQEEVPLSPFGPGYLQIYSLLIHLLTTTHVPSSL